jgi:hypothetical protein
LRGKRTAVVCILFLLLLVGLSIVSAQAVYQASSHNEPKVHPLVLREPLFVLHPSTSSPDILVTGTLEGTPGAQLTIRIILQVTPTQTEGLTHGIATFTWTDKGGNQIMGTLDGYIKAISSTESSIFFTFTIADGTGKYDGAIGGGLHWGTITTDTTTGVTSGSGWYVGTITY